MATICNNKVPFFSVCIPTFNMGRFIGEAVESAFEQSFLDYEIVVSDNCSSDNTEEIIKSLKDDRIRYFKNDSNIGMYPNLNKLVQQAKGRYIKILCADDKLSPNCLKIIHDNLNRFGDTNKMILVDCCTDEKLLHRDLLNTYPTRRAKRNSLFDFLYNAEGVGSGLSNFCVDKDFFIANGCFGDCYGKTEYSRDVIVSLGLMLKSDFLLINLPLVFERPHPGQNRFSMQKVFQLDEFMSFFLQNGEVLNHAEYSSENVYPYLDRLVAAHFWSSLKRILGKGDFSYFIKMISILNKHAYHRLPVKDLVYRAIQIIHNAL